MPAISGKIIYQTKTFSVVTLTHRPHIPRQDGGHIMICATEKYFPDRTALSPKEATELMRLSMMAAEAFQSGMVDRGVNVERINFQENGNWAFLHDKPPVFHLHLYGRTKNAKSQTWGEALYFPDPHDPRYEQFEPLNDDDCEMIRSKLHDLAHEPRFSDEAWGLKTTQTVKVKRI